MRSRVKVSTERLLEAVRARREKEVQAHAKALARSEAERKKVCAKVAKALREAADRAEAGDLPETGYNNRLEVPWQGRIPAKVNPEPNTNAIDRLIATLEMVTEPTISINADDAAQYLG